MEIQTFLLSKSVQKIGRGSEYNGSLIGIHSFFSLDRSFPLNFEMPYFMLLRRAHRDGEERVMLRFSLVDMDGRSCGSPQSFSATGVFPSGFRFMTLAGKIQFSFPGMGDYRLDITADEHELSSTYHYDIEITSKP